MITPNEVRQTINPASIKRAEDIIDKALKESVRRDMCCTISHSLLTQCGLPMIAVRELMSRYHKAGWNTIYTSDQRDGDFWTLTPRIP